MELKLNIYKGTEVVKTYTANDFTLKTGTCEDIVNAIDIDKLLGSGLNNDQLGVEVIKLVTKNFNKFRPFLQDIFPELTDEEYRNTAIKETGNIMLKVVNYTIGELFSVKGSNSKN
jgi:hypothetical protein